MDACAVVGSPDVERGEIVKAFIVLRKDVAQTPTLAREIQDHVKAVTAPYKYPRAVEFVEALPMIVLTNCDYVEFQFGAFPPKRVYPDRENYPHLPHAPVVIDHRHVDFAEIGAWGMRWQDGRFTGFVDGEPVAEVRLSGKAVATTLEFVADDAELRAGEKDATRFIVRALDQFGNVLPVFDDPHDAAAIATYEAWRQLGYPGATA